MPRLKHTHLPHAPQKVLAPRGSAAMVDRHRKRLERQFDALSRKAPFLEALRPIIQVRPGILVRVPLALLFLAGGLLFVLPFFGLWMIPLGLMVLAIDLPVLRPMVTAGVIRLRRRWVLWRRKCRD
jgi:hypothetical protein